MQPSLLDRLADNSPARPRAVDSPATGSTGDAERKRHQDANATMVLDTEVISARQLRDCVRRDLAWLLNTACLENSALDLSAFPLARESVINFGIPELTGMVASAIDTPALEKRLANIIYRYEPRIMKHTLSIKITRADVMSGNALSFEIECDVWGRPLPERMYLYSELDLEGGMFSFDSRKG